MKQLGKLFWGLLLLSVVSHAQTTITAKLVVHPDFNKLSTGFVTRVVDGDTIVLKLNGQEVNCRLIGVDTPETVHPQKAVEFYGKEASRFTSNLIKGEYVWVAQDTGNTVDKYGRLLAYLFRQPDGLFVKQELVRQGYAHAYLIYPFSMMENFKAMERAARIAGRSLWDPKLMSVTAAPPQGQQIIVYATTSGTKYHSAGCRFLAKSRIPLTLQAAKEK